MTTEEKTNQQQKAIEYAEEGVRRKRLTKEIHNDYWEDDGFVFETIDSEGQKLEFRIGMVFHGDEVADEDGIWIEYQEHFQQSESVGPILLSPRTFEKLIQHYLFRKFQRTWIYYVWRQIDYYRYSIWHHLTKHTKRSLK